MEAGGFLHPEQVIQQINFSPKQIVADFGCGAGYFTVLMAQAVGPDGQVFACDVQEPPLETVLSKAKTANVFNIKTIHCNLETPQSTKLAANSVDWIMLANILFQSQKKDTIIEEAKRILKPTGKIIMIDWLPQAVMAPKDGWPFTKDQGLKLGQQLGFTLDKDIVAGQYHWGIILKK